MTVDIWRIAAQVSHSALLRTEFTYWGTYVDARNGVRYLAMEPLQQVRNTVTAHAYRVADITTRAADLLRFDLKRRGATEWKTGHDFAHMWGAQPFDK